MTTTTHVLVLDFDGTVCLGDAPVFAYARLLDESLSQEQWPSGDDDLVLVTVRRFLGDVGAHAERSGEGGQFTGPSAGVGSGIHLAQLPSVDEAFAMVAGSVDGYEACERLARALGATRDQRAAAYAGSRAELASGAITTWAPEGLGELLRALPAHVQVVLVTNAPETGVTQQLVQLELADCFSEVVTSAGKPKGMAPIVSRLLLQHDIVAHPARLLSVGDIWRNDLGPASLLGCETALIERLPAPTDARPTYRAPTIEQLYPAITTWAAVSSIP